ncbi:hypothetical protein GDO78_011238 [Eleutherodactylus coqui]|uniref:Uncharacterized protein n=1 Tax=Eleutherodactylus coqui TaxID=57060 RepID=A0A8J6F8F2_ELECQ|nr:hypothetical protein GDO78_011238 [Eleutherodactylus coqui]
MATKWVMRIEECSLCPAGYYCLSNTSYPIPCPPGSYNPLEGQDEVVDCTPCPAGSACTRSGLTQPDTDCSPGYEPSLAPSTSVLLAHGATGPAWHLTENVIHVLLAGSAWPELKLPLESAALDTSVPRDAGSSICLPCLAGHYCNQDRTSRERMMQLLCPAGTVCSKGMAVFPGEDYICPQGYYCPEGSQEAKPCPNGTYGFQTGLEGLEDCLLCPEGNYCYQEGQSGIPSPNGLCPPGYYCPAGTGSPMSYPCQPGTYWNMTKQGVEISVCLPCPAGFFCDMPSLTAPKICPAGFYCHQGSSNPQPCPEGTYGPREESSTEDGCLTCEPGKFCSGVGLSTISGNCQEGFYCSERSTSATPSGGICPAGSYCPASSAWPVLCPPGTYSNQVGLTEVSQCLICPPGMFCNGDGGSSPTGNCTAGYYCTEGSSSPVQQEVKQGYYSMAGAFRPEPCPPGTFQPLPARSSCTLCPPGNFCNASSLSEVFSCPQGHFCPAGSQSVCSICPVGHSCLSGDILLCPLGYFCPEGMNTGPIPCPPGTFSSVTGLTNADGCLPCPPGMFCSNWGSRTVSGSCDPGFFCTGVFSGEGGSCPRGHYCPAGSSHPYACPAGTYNNLTHQQDCLPCPAGYSCAGNSSDYSAFPCPAGFYCPGGTQHSYQFPCPRGYYNPDPSSHSIDSCLPCTPGHYCGEEGLSAVSGMCDPGWFCVSAAWTPQPFDLDNYTSANCLCPATSTGGKCLPGFYCPEGTTEPIPCPPGFYCENAGLGSPSGECSAGFFCTGGTKTPRPLDGLQGNICPPSTFCPNGSHYPQLCPPGTFSAEYSLGNVSECKPCPPGLYCNGSGMVSPTGRCSEGYFCELRAQPVRDYTQFRCPKGYFCPPGTQFGTQHGCPEGTYGPRRGLSSITDCALCPPGRFCKGSGQATPTGNCSSGYWCKEGATDEHPQDGLSGDICPPGHYCPEGFYCPQGTALDWRPCRPGTYSSELGLENSAGCRVCDGGKYCMSPNSSGVTGDCAEGYYCTAGSQQAEPDEERPGSAGPCPPGHFCPRGSVIPTPCPLGTFSSRIKLHSEAGCLPCVAGHYCDSPGLLLPTGPCTEGFYCISSSISSQLFSVSPMGGPCPTGHFCPVGSSAPQPCPPGTFNSIERQGACQPCTEGFFCLNNTSSLEGKECPPGFYCPTGTLFPGQFPCPRGTYNLQRGSHLLEDCLPCDPGHYCDTPGQTQVSGLCSEGYFCAQSAKTSTPNEGNLGDVCPSGHYCPAGSAIPHPCPAGSYSNTSGNVGPEACVPCESELLCPVGHHCPPGSSEPRACPMGQFQDKTGQSQCEECPVGYFCVEGTEYGRQHPCPAGTYSNLTRLTSAEECSPCPGGWFCARPEKCLPGYYCTLNAQLPNPADGSSGGLCPAGYYCPLGSRAPLPCPPGAFQPYLGMSSLDSCLPCPAGKFCRGEALSHISGFFQDLEKESSCKICPPRFYCDTSELGGVVNPQPCPAAGELHIQPAQSSHTCRSVLLETHRSTAECRSCPSGFYCADEGLTEPSGRCLLGYWCIGRAETSNPTDGVTGNVCPAGKFCENGDISGDCQAGYFCDVQSFRSDQTLCPPGCYCPEGTSSPVPCDTGTYAPLSGNKAPDDCRPCPSGHFCNGKLLYRILLGESTGISMPSLCPSGHYCPQGASFITVYPCPSGTYGPKTGASSISDCESCPAGMYCSSEGLSKPTGYCYAGYYCSQGAINPTPITPRNDICPVGHFCPNGTRSPVPCPPGSFSMAAGLSTLEECQPCPAGHYCPQAGLSDPSLALPCSPGYVCREGSSVPCPSDDLHGYRCPAGFYCPSGASIEIPCDPVTFSPMSGSSMCLPCPAGSSCMHVSTVEPLSCPRGHYCPAMTAVPIPCPAGTFNPIEGVLTLASCRRCPAGRYCRGEANSEPDGLCSAGFYCEGEAADKIPQKTTRFPLNGPCPAGHYCPEGTLSPKPCPVGTLKNATGGSSTDSCVPCYAGYFCASVGLTSPTGLCSAGFFCPGNFTSTSPTAFLCPKGHFCTAGSSHPLPCPTGQYQPNTGSHSCTPCQPGFYCQEAVAGHPQPCPPYSYCPAGTLYPLPCPNGTYTSMEMSGLREKGECLPCPPGHYCRGGKLQGPCAAGHFCLSGSSEYTPYVQNFSRSSLTECSWGQMCFYCQEGTVSPTPCPTNTVRSSPGGRHRDDCVACPRGYWCKEGNPVLVLCPPGHYCSGENRNNSGHTAEPQECPVHTYRALAGAERAADCQSCPPGYFCKLPGTVMYEDYPCPPGYWCPGTSDPLACPAGTLRTEPGAASIQDCEICPDGYYCPNPAVTLEVNIIGIPCRSGYECPSGSISESSCRAGSYCTPRTGIPPLCPSGFFCPEGSTTYNTSSKNCVCRGLNRSFQESDGSCICQAGFVFYDNREKQRSDSNSDLDCQPQVEERCSSAEVRLSATRKCVSPERYDCTPSCGLQGGELSAELGICHCSQYVSAEELCDRFCLMKVPRISMSFGSNMQFQLQIEESERRRSRNLEVLNVLGPDHHVWSSEQVHLVLFSPSGVFGVILSSTQVIEVFLTGDSWSVPTPRKSRAGDQVQSSTGLASLPRIPNPILCLKEGDVVLFQLSISPNDRMSSHYPLYQKDHLFNTNPHWDFGAFRRLDHLIRETHINVSRFAHVFTDPGTYVFLDNGIKDRFLFVMVKDNNVYCDPAASRIQPSSPYQLVKQGIVTQHKLNLAPNWAAILGILLLLFIIMVTLLVLTLVLRPSLFTPRPLKSWKPRWRSLGEPYIPPEYVLTKDRLYW